MIIYTANGRKYQRLLKRRPTNNHSDSESDDDSDGYSDIDYYCPEQTSNKFDYQFKEKVEKAMEFEGTKIDRNVNQVLPVLINHSDWGNYPFLWPALVKNHCNICDLKFRLT